MCALNTIYVNQYKYYVSVVCMLMFAQKTHSDSVENIVPTTTAAVAAAEVAAL